MSLDEFDVWMSINSDRLRQGNTAMQELLPYVNTCTGSDVLQPLVARLESAVTDVTYSDFDSGHLSAMYAHAGSSFRAGLDAIAVGNGPVAGECVSLGMVEYQDAVHCLLEELEGRQEPRQPLRRRWWFVAVLVLLLAVLII